MVEVRILVRMSDQLCEMSFDGDSSPEILRAYKELQEERRRYFSNKIVCDALENCNLPAELREKVDEIVLNHKLKDCVNLEDGLKALELKETENTLTYDDTQIISKAVDEKILETKAEIEESIEPFKDVSWNQTVLNQRLEDEYMETLRKHQLNYVQNQFQLSQILEKIYEIRTQQVQTLFNTKLEECSTLERVNTSRNEVLNIQTKKSIFNEFPETLEAFKTFLSDLKASQIEDQRKINEMKILKQKYEDAKCPEYDQILKSFVEYTKSLETIKKLYKE